FVGDALQLARSLLDGALDVVERHVLGLGGVDGGAEPRVAAGVAAALLGGDCDLADQLGEERSPARVGDGLLPLDLLPFAMTSHGSNLPLSPIGVEHILEPHPPAVEVE